MLMVTAASIKPANEDALRKAVVEADKLYNEHLYKKLHDFLLQYKVCWQLFTMWLHVYYYIVVNKFEMYL